MAKRRYGFDEAKVSRFLIEGRGQGSGRAYQPWLTIQDVSSHGRSTRIHSRKTQREHHLLSDNETAVFLMLDWSDKVTDIREQFPLDRDLTRRIAAEMGVVHPVDPHTRIDIVMTTDFLIDLDDATEKKMIARSVKPYGELEDKRTLEKQEIERRYWEVKGVDWALIIDIDLPVQRIKNLRWLHELQSLEHMVSSYQGYWEDRCTRFLACISQANTMSMKQFIRYMESSQGFAAGEVITTLRHLAANKVISMDLDARFDINSSIDAIHVNSTTSSLRRTA